MRTTPRVSEIKIVDGVARLDGRPAYLSSVDYPYYRDGTDHWTDRLDALGAMGHRFITSYVSWRHHELEIDGERRFDFTGESVAPVCQVDDQRYVADRSCDVLVSVEGGVVEPWTGRDGPDRVTVLATDHVVPQRSLEE
jgi:glycosyl hydrolase family 35